MAMSSAPTPSGELNGLSGENRRQHVRHALNVGATVATEGGASRACRIQDFCAGGLFLSVEGANGSGIVIGDKAGGWGCHSPWIHTIGYGALVMTPIC